MKAAVLFFSMAFCILFSNAQPSDAQVKKDATGNGSGVIGFKLTKTTGTKQWNSDIGNWEYVRGVEIKRNSNYPGINLIVKGDVVYQYMGVGKYSYWKFRILSNEYEGIPNPSATEINDFVSKDWQKFYGYYYQKIIKLHQQPLLADDPGWIWHSPNSVEFRMKLKFDHIISYTDVETLDCIWKVRLYRDDPKGAWKNMFAQRSEDAADLKIVGKQNYTPAQMKDLEKKTLQYTLAEETAQQKNAALPAVELPEFKSAEDMVKYIHNVLRNGNPEQYRAVMTKLFAPGFFVEGSKVQLRPEIDKAIEDINVAAYKDKSTYKQMYCQNPPYKVEKWPDGRKTIYISGAVNNCNSYFIAGPVNMGYVDGVAQTKLRILEFQVYVRHDDDAISYINSFSDRKKLCGND